MIHKLLAILEHESKQKIGEKQIKEYSFQRSLSTPQIATQQACESLVLNLGETGSRLSLRVGGMLSTRSSFLT